MAPENTIARAKLGGILLYYYIALADRRNSSMLSQLNSLLTTDFRSPADARSALRESIEDLLSTNQ